MSAKEDSLSINHFLNKFIDTRTSEDQRLPASIALSYVKILRTNIINKYDKQERVNSVVVLAKVVRYLPKSNAIVDLFDEVLFKELMKIGTQKPCDLTGDSVFKILNSVLTKHFVESQTKTTFQGIYNSLYNNLKFIEVIAIRFEYAIANSSLSGDAGALVSSTANKANIAESAYLTFEFTCHIYYCLPLYYKFDYVGGPILDTIRNHDMALYVEKLVKLKQISYADYQRLITLSLTGAKEISKRLHRTPIDLNNPNHKKTIELLLKHTRKNYQNTTSTSNTSSSGESLSDFSADTEIYEISGITSNPVKYLADNFPMAVLYNCRIFLLRYSDDFRRKYYEQLILTNRRNRFPLIKMCLAVCSFLSNELFASITGGYHSESHSNAALASFTGSQDFKALCLKYYKNFQDFFIFYDAIFSVLMFKSLEFWEESKAENFYAVAKLRGHKSSQFDYNKSSELSETINEYDEKIYSDHSELTEDEHDIEVLIDLIKAIMRYLEPKIDSSVQSKSHVLELIKSVTFEKAREEQLKQIFTERQAVWGKEIDAFDNVLELEVANFVKEERTLQLIKGFWFYADDPRSKANQYYVGNNANGAGYDNGSNAGSSSIHTNGNNSNNITSTTTNGSNGNSSTTNTSQNIPTSRHKKGAKKFFVCLAPNRQYILFKEFIGKATAAPILDKSNSRTIMLSAIKDVKVASTSDLLANGLSGISSNNSSSLAFSKQLATSHHINLFINIKSRSHFHRIVLLGRDGKELISFYTDTSDLASIWADGIKLLLNKPIKAVSDFTKQQIEKLFDVRRGVQFSSILDSNSDVPNSAVSTAAASSLDVSTSTDLNENGIAKAAGALLASSSRKPSKLSNTLTLDEDEDEELYDYDELITATEGCYYD